MKAFNSKKILLTLLAMAVIFVCSFAAELLWFNRDILALESSERILTEVRFTELELRDLEFSEEGIFSVTGQSPAFRVKEDLFISKLQVATNGQTPPMHISSSAQDKLYDIHSTMKGLTILRVNDRAQNVWFSISVDSGDGEFALDSFWVDNTLTINWLRILLMCSVAFVVMFFVMYHKMAETKLHVSFFVLALTIGINIALATPAWYGLDEGAHYIRAYQLAHFNLGFDHEEELNWINDMEDFFFYTGYTNAPHNTYDERVEFFKSYATEEYGLSKYFPTTAATYPFVPYFFAGLGIMLTKLLGMPFVYTFYAGRIFNVLGYALICYFAIKHARFGKRLLFLMSLLPYTLFSAAVYTADTLTISFALLATAIFLNMLTAEDGSLDFKLPVLFGVCVGAMAMCKLPYAPFCILALAVPMKKFRSVKAAIWNFVLVFAVVGGISVATLLFGADKGIIQWYQPGMSIVGQVKFILTHLFRYAWIMLCHVLENWQDYLFGSTWKMGFVSNVNGVWAGITILVLAVLAFTDYENENQVVTLLPKLACVGTILCSWALVLTALYVSYNVVGADTIQGVQGRYFYPLLLPLLLLLKNTRIKLSVEERYLNAGCYAIAAVMSVTAVTHVFTGFCM